MCVDNVQNLGQHQVVERPWLTYGCVPQYGTYHLATFLFTATVDGTVWQNKDGGNLSNQMDAAPPAPPAWLPLWVQYHRRLHSKANTLPCHACKVYLRAGLSTNVTTNDAGDWAFRVDFLQRVRQYV
jgi:hypothetical protein